MKKIDVKELTDNVVDVMSNEWMLVTAGNKESFNTMTVSWGGVGFLWQKPVVFIFIRPERYTHEFIEKSDSFTLSFLGKENRDIYNICGSKSGRDIDKMKATGLTPTFTPKGLVTFEQSRLTIACKKIYKSVIDKKNFLDPSISKWYGERGGFHEVYVAEITDVWVKE